MILSQMISLKDLIDCSHDFRTFPHLKDMSGTIICPPALQSRSTILNDRQLRFYTYTM